MRYARLWTVLGLVVAGSFAVLGLLGREIYQQAPPRPKRVITTDGKLLFTRQQILDGQNVWQTIGGQELGTVWGHGAYVAPDWTADYLHRESMWILNTWARQEHQQLYDQLTPEQQAALRARLQTVLRTNGYNPHTGDLVVPPIVGQAVEAMNRYYSELFGKYPGLAGIRNAYAMPAGTVDNAVHQQELNAFFFWATWACAANRPGQTISYTNDWPPEPLVGNRPTGSMVVWSVVSFVLLLAGIGGLAWYYAIQYYHGDEEALARIPDEDPFLRVPLTSSMKATLKYFWVVIALFVIQVIMGGITAHYGVEGTGFYGVPLAKWIPYVITRTWHLQLGIFWIATAWLATGLFIAPVVSGKEMKGQRFGVDLLFVCLLAIVVGSMFGQYLAIHHDLGLQTNFWFGHQGYEYLDLGRFWQIFLFIGLFLWLFLMIRALWPALTRQDESRELLALFVLSAVAIASFYGAGLLYGRQTNLAIEEYWRWWVVHLWVEGFFEVFSTVVIAFLFARMGLIRVRTATASVLFTTIIFLTGGIIGTFHHLYFTGTPTAVLAFGATFSALEIVPLVMIGFEGYSNIALHNTLSWVQKYRWPIYFLVAVSFWNLVGAGLFGFLINPPIALYYMQGLNTTPVHAHTALFGVYGMLGLGLMLFCFRAFTAQRAWNTRVLGFAFWAINIGLMLMVILSLLPIGLIQTWASVTHGMWYARSVEITQMPIMQTLRWMRLIGDTTFAVGALALGWFVLGLKTGWSYVKEVA